MSPCARPAVLAFVMLPSYALPSQGVSLHAGASPAFKQKELAVVGGGDTALEEAVYLTKYGKHVSAVFRVLVFRLHDSSGLMHQRIALLVAGAFVGPRQEYAGQQSHARSSPAASQGVSASEHNCGGCICRSQGKHGWSDAETCRDRYARTVKHACTHELTPSASDNCDLGFQARQGSCLFGGYFTALGTSLTLALLQARSNWMRWATFRFAMQYRRWHLAVKLGMCCSIVWRAGA